MRTASKKAFPLARRELEFMNVVWDLEEATAQQVQEAIRKRGRKLRESTVRTILRVLEDKGFLRHRIEGRAYVYRSAFSREDARSMAVHDIVHRLFADSVPDMVTHLLNPGTLSASERSGVRDAVRRALRA